MGSVKPVKKADNQGGHPGKIDAPLAKKLQAAKWGEYKIGDLFTSANGNFDIQKYHINDKGEYVITSGLTNNGVLGRSDVEANVFDCGTITVDMFGYAFYRQFKYKMVTHARVFSLSPRHPLTTRQGLFVECSMRFLRHKFGYENMCSFEKIKNEKIFFPQNNGSIDFDFMEHYIAELEAERTAELEAYLTVSGLKDYALTKEEQKILEDYKEQEFGDFDVTDIFEIKNSGNILSSDIVEGSGDTPYLCASTANNGVSTYITYDEKYKDKGNCIFIGGKTFVVTYQEHDFYSNDSHNLILYLKDAEQRTKLKQLYIATCINRSLKHKYPWNASISKAKIKKEKVALPVNNKLQPHYKTMETFMSAIQKLVIKDVIKYADKKIAATYEVAGKK